MKGKTGNLIYGMIGIICVMCVIFQWISYRGYAERSGQKKQEREEQVQKVEQSEVGILKPGATCTYVFYNRKTGKQEIRKSMLASAFIGWKREEFETYLREYERERKREEKGLCAVELVSFSRDAVVLKKSYENKQSEYRYMIGVRENEIVVYDRKKGKKPEWTGMDAQQLEQSERQKLSRGIYVKDESELYSILEDYSS